MRSRLIKTHEAYGGIPCDGITGGGSSLDGIQTGTEKTECNTQICPPSMSNIFLTMIGNIDLHDRKGIRLLEKEFLF